MFELCNWPMAVTIIGFGPTLVLDNSADTIQSLNRHNAVCTVLNFLL